MRVRPSSTCCGCFPLLLGVLLICLSTLCVDIITIAISSSTERLQIMGLIVPATLEVAAATWAFIGIPIVVAGGVGVLYRIEQNVRCLFWYLLFSFISGLVIPFWFMLSGNMCNVVVDQELQRMGSAFVCGFTDTFVFMWTLIFGVMHAYLVYIVWSAAEEIAQAPYPELMRYNEAIKNVRVPGPPAGAYPMSPSRAMPAEAAYGPPPVGQPFISAGPGYGQPGMTNRNPGMVGAPVQSYQAAGNPFMSMGPGGMA